MIKGVSGTVKLIQAIPGAQTATELVKRMATRGFKDTGRRVMRRATRSVENKLGLNSLDFPLDSADIASSQTVGSFVPHRGTENLKVAWICSPPGPGSGGHTTFFRMVQAVQDAGIPCTILLFNHHGGDMQRHIGVIRASWPWLTADIEQVPERISGYSSCVASSWDTAHVLASRRVPGEPMNPFYLIQDFEPYFYPRGSLYALAEDSYRFGFTNLALGEMVAQTLRREVGVDSVVIPFGSDTTNYHRTTETERSGVVFFARPSVDRRGFDIGRLALEEFHQRHPEQTIHTFGSYYKGYNFPAVQHGTLSPGELNALYNQTVTGLALSFTNITLIAAEMLAAGNIAVLNDDHHAKLILRNPEAVWRPATPAGLADGLSSVIEDENRVRRSAQAAAFAEVTWEEAQQKLLQEVCFDGTFAS